MSIVLPDPAKQTFMYGSLIEARRTVLHDALLDTLGKLKPDVISSELAQYAPVDARQTLAAVGIRDEAVFVVPAVIRETPTLLGYYRLLYGVSKKGFYTSATGLARFRKLEEANEITDVELALLPELCTELNAAVGKLVAAIGKALNDADIQQLPLLTLGAQLDGAHRTVIGKTATREVFQSIKAVVKASGVDYDEVEDVSISFTNSAARQVTVVLASDPDVVIQEEVAPGRSLLKVAIEIKGGTDRSNVHNRAGEAEKSHQKVKGHAGDFWTVISLTGTSQQALHGESPTTRHWFDVAEVIGRKGSTWLDFKTELSVALGIALS